MTDTPRREIQVGRIRVQFFVKRGVNRTPTQPLAKAFAPLRVSTPAATAFDLIRYAARLGGIERAVETLAPLIPLIRAPDLKAVLQAEGEVAAAQRLGYLLESAGRAELTDVSAVTEPPRGTRAWFRGQCLKKWPSSVVTANWDSLVFDLGVDPLRRVP